MESYSSENSDSDEERDRKLINFSYKLLDSETLYHYVENSLEPEIITKFYIHQNILTEIPKNISKFHNLRKIDFSNNRLSNFPEILCKLPLKSIIAKNNAIDDFSLPKTFENLANTLEVLNLAGNHLTNFPEQIFNLSKLRCLYLGHNRIKEIPSQIHQLKRLEILSLGENALRDVPASVCRLHELQALILSDNELEKLPACIANLKKLRTLQLHRNRLKTLPTEIVTLKYLTELSLRDNPLVIKFVSDMMHDPPTLREISARIIKLHDIPYSCDQLPNNLVRYLSTAHHCLNPNCEGVYFDSRVEHIKFVDFCGKYRLPLLQYLCSSTCINPSSNSNGHRFRRTTSSHNNDLMRKVLLG